MPSLACPVVAAVLLAAQPRALQPRNTFVGTTPCGDAVRAFVGGMPAGEKCHAIKWELTLGTTDAANRWSLTAVFGVPPASNPNAMIDGPKVTKQGTLTSSTVQRLGATSTVFRLAGDAGSSISFAVIGADLVNLAGNDGSLVPGDAAASYTLTRADRLEPAVVAIPRVAEGSLSVHPNDFVVPNPGAGNQGHAGQV